MEVESPFHGPPGIDGPLTASVRLISAPSRRTHLAVHVSIPSGTHYRKWRSFELEKEGFLKGREDWCTPKGFDYPASMRSSFLCPSPSVWKHRSFVFFLPLVPEYGLYRMSRAKSIWWVENVILLEGRKSITGIQVLAFHQGPTESPCGRIRRVYVQVEGREDA